MSEPKPFPVVVEVETTGFSNRDRVLEIAVVRLDPDTGETVDEYDTLLQPNREVGPTFVHGITSSMVELAPTFDEILADLARRLQGGILVGHNLPFDRRFLRSEFERSRVPADWGDGLCTLKETRQKLTVACEARGIEHDQPHRALADARATAELFRRLRLSPSSGARPVHIGFVEQRPGARTVRRDLVDPGSRPMPRIVSRAHYPHCDEAVLQYLDALDQVLDDGVLDEGERSDLEELAAEWKIPESVRRDAHRTYLGSVIAAAQRDGVITEAEHSLIGNIARQLGIPATEVPEVTQLPEVLVLAAGMGVCFTGTADLEGHTWERARLEELAENAALETVPSVSRSRCQVLVAADVSSASGKARQARRLGIPILSVAEFVAKFG